ncbi:MAG: polysaccharide biosynthesis/export family protein [Pseudomonadota bacterium]
MRLAVFAATLGLCGCGAIYTSPDVYDSGSAFGGAPAFDVAVVPMTVETAMEANLSPYVPARLPDSFRPAPTAAPPPLSAGGARMPVIPDPVRESVGPAAEAQAVLPPAATEEELRAERARVDLPELEDPSPYRIGVADVLLLSTNTAGATLEDVPTLLSAQNSRQGYIVQDDGAIAIPDVGRIPVSGLTLEEAEAEIFQALVAQRVDPSFSLEVAEFNSQTVSIGGAVQQPRVAPISLKPLFLSTALQLAGGVRSADLDDVVVRLFRDGEVFQAPLREIYDDDGLVDVLLKDGDAIFVDADFDVTQARAFFEEQLRLREAELREREFAFRQRQADIDEVRFGVTIAQFELQKAQLRQQINQMRIAVAEFNLTREAQIRAASADQRSAFRERLELGAVARDYVYVSGEVRRPSRFPLPFENRANLADMLFFDEAGGLSINVADYGEIYVLRQGVNGRAPGAVTAFHLDAANVANLSMATLFEMRPNDIVFVAEQPVTTWNRVINQLTPNLITQAVSVANVAGN